MGRSGEGVRGFEARRTMQRDALIRFCKDSLAPYKALKDVEFCSALPRTGLGKIDRAKIGLANPEGARMTVERWSLAAATLKNFIRSLYRELAVSSTADH